MTDSNANVNVQSSVPRWIGIAAIGVVGVALFVVLIVNRSMSKADADPVSDVADDEQVVFFPTYASYDRSKNEWKVHVRGWLFEDEADSTKRRPLRAGVRKYVGVPDDVEARKRFNHRIGRFLADGERGKTVAVKFGSQTYSLDETDKAGHCGTTIRVGDADIQSLRKKNAGAAAGWIPLNAVLKKGDSRRFSGAVLPISETGLSVISDIDDTIKITNVTNRDEMLANSLYRPFRPVVGMPDLYRELHKRGAVFHYVSGSPWQLYEPLAAFLTKQRFPRGTMHLRRFRLKDIRSLPDIAKPTGKQEAIETLLKEFPKRRFLLFGDSGERDPEIYGDVARQHARQIVGVLIRNVTDEKPDGARIQAAFREIGKRRWVLFAKPQAAKAVALKLAGE